MKEWKNFKSYLIREKKYDEGDPRYYRQYVYASDEVADKIDIKSIAMVILIISFVIGYLVLLNNKTIEQSKKREERQIQIIATPKKTEIFQEWRVPE